MADVTLSYKGSDILELSDSGSATLKTGGKYCEDDIAVEYVKPSGGVEITKTTYTHVEDWLDNFDTYQKFADAYFTNPSTFFYVAVINNTSTENLAGQSAVWDAVITNIMVCRRRSSLGSGPSYTFKIGAGSTITVYAIDGGAFT